MTNGTRMTSGTRRMGLHRLAMGATLLAVAILTSVNGARAHGLAGDLARDSYGELVPLDHWPVAGDRATAAGGQRSAVVLVPGLLAGERSMGVLRQPLADAKIPTAIFRYDSSVGTEPAADRLKELLAAELASQPQVRITLVTHSMGGLVARRVLESPDWASDRVDRLVMIAPPNAGSSLATLDSAEVRRTLSNLKFDQQRVLIDERAARLLDSALGQFLGDAKQDLAPGSEVLQGLSRLERNPRVRYSILAGSGGPIPGWVRTIGQLLLAQQSFQRPEQAEKLKTIFETANRDEWIEGLGDGVVAIRSTRLSGVSDHQELDFAHNDISQSPDTPAARRLVDEVMRRVQAKPAE